MTIRMQDFQWNLTEDDMAKMFPDLPEEDRAEAAENYSQYLQVVSRIYDRLKDEGKLEELTFYDE